MIPYWQTKDGRVLLYYCKAEELLATMPDNSVDLMLVDPPYGKRTHKGARKNVKGKKGGDELLDFKHISDEALRAILDDVGRVMKRWMVGTMDYHHAFLFEQSPPKHMKVPRLGVWVKSNPMPQVSADRPSQGWESIVYAHKVGRKMTWAGGGRSGVFICPVTNKAQYASQKPLQLVREFVQLFSDVGDTVMDPFCGGGTSAVAAFESGRCAITCDPSLKALDVTIARLQEVERRGLGIPGVDLGLKQSKRVKVEQGQLFG